MGGYVSDYGGTVALFDRSRLMIPKLPKELKQFFVETGRTGGLTRAKNLTAARRLEIAHNASKAAAEARTLRAKKRGITSTRGAKASD